METELQEHLDEQRAALAQVHEALQEAVALGDAPCEEAEVLRQMASELQAAIQELEAALLEMARARLLAALDPISATTAPEPPAPQGAPAEPISTAQACAVAVGEPCRFRGLDGRWYAGRLIALEAGTAVVQHAMPTRRHMLDPLRMSASSLRPTRAITSEAQHAVGDIVYVRPAALTGGRPTESSRQGSLWQPADVVEVDELAGTVVVLLGPQRLRLRIAADDATPSAAAGNSDLDSSSSSSSSSDDSSSRQKSHDGEQAARGADEGNSEPRPASEHAALQHVRAALQAGANTSTVHFSTWERHTRGVASKLMARMGYRMGSGLGASGRGRAEPVPAIILPPKVGLGAGPGAAGQADGANEDAAPDGLLDRASKRRKGRARRQRRGLQRRTAREAAEDEALQQEKANGAPGLFGFINVALGDASEAASKIRAVERALLKQDRVVPEEGGSGGRAAPQGSKQGSSRDTRQSLMDQHQAINACQAKVAHFQAMLARNRSNPGLAPAIASKLRTAQAELAAAQAEQSRVTSSLRAVAQKQAYMKF